MKQAAECLIVDIQVRGKDGVLANLNEDAVLSKIFAKSKGGEEAPPLA